jgi:hypothetical protein
VPEAEVSSSLKADYSFDFFHSMVAFESIFALNIFLKFFVSYNRPSDLKKISALQQTAQYYIRNGLLQDLIPILPLQFWKLTNNRNALFYLIKALRLIKGFSLLDPGKLLLIIKKIKAKKAKNPPCDCMFEDHNKIEQTIMLGHFFRFIKIFIMILNFTYLLAIFWRILCYNIEDFWYNVDYIQLDYSNPEVEEAFKNNFMVYYGLYKTDFSYQFAAFMYFAFTTLSTVGFGDFAPRSDFERVVGSFILLLGVAIFSYILGNFQEILMSIKTFNEEPNEDEKFAKFLGVLKKYNHNVPIDLELKQEMWTFFDYKWKNDKNAIMFADENMYG